MRNVSMKHPPPLTPNEVHMAACHGVLRRYEKLKGMRGDRPQKERSSWDNEIEGACCELAVSKWLGVSWSGAGGIRADDVASYEVKWTRHSGKGGLIVHKYFDDDAKFLLFDGFAPNFKFVGWAYGREAKQEEYMQDWGAYLLPRDKLHIGQEVLK